MFLPVDQTVAQRAITTARRSLYEVLATLDQAQWNTPSLSDGWRVRHVVAHLILEYQYSPRTSWRAFVRSGLSINRFFYRTAVEFGDRPTNDLLSLYKELIDNHHSFKRISPMNVLTDTLVHTQDICRPLGIAHPMPEAALRLIFESWRPETYNLGERVTGLASRLRGLELEATDLDIRAGRGLLVSGPAETILMGVTGRRVSLNALQGEGAPILISRIRS